MYKIYIGEKLLPIAPDKITWINQNNNNTFSLVDGTQICVPKPSSLTQVSFDFLLPRFKYVFSHFEDDLFEEPESFIEYFYNLKNLVQPFTFAIWRRNTEGKLLSTKQFYAIMEDFNIIEDVSYGTDIYAHISLREFKTYGTAIVDSNLSFTSSTTNVPSVSLPTPQTYTVKSGDNLWSICKKFLGDGSKCYEIAELNNITNPNKISIGQVIKFG